MSGQNLKMQKGNGSFVVGGSELTPDTALGNPYPGSAGQVNFVVRGPTEQDVLSGSNRPTTPQHDSAHPTVAFLYSDWIVTS